ncbi:MAG: hypothetical protein ACREQ5_06320 [Candidatus Dormibacteria bacterium]
MKLFKVDRIIHGSNIYLDILAISGASAGRIADDVKAERENWEGAKKQAMKAARRTA